jgi:hypothetical protein
VEKLSDVVGVKTALIEYIKEHGYGGLVNPDFSCGCGLDDLAPCDSFDECELGYEQKAHCDSCDVENCDARGETEKCYTSEKPVEMSVVKEYEGIKYVYTDTRNTAA